MTLAMNSETSASKPNNGVSNLNFEKINGSKANTELLAYVNDKFEKCRGQRTQFERQWYTNLAFYFGRHYVQWATPVASDFARLVEPKAPPWRVRLVVNKVRAIIRTELAKITKEKPRGFVIPASTDDQDLAAARAGEAIFEHLWRELQMNRLIRRTEFWNLLCGTSFIKDYYDPNSKDLGGVPGRITAEHVSPFHLLVPDLQEEEIEFQPYVIHALAKTPEWVNDTFKVQIAPDTGSGAGMLESKFLSALGLQSAGAKSLVSVKEIWLKPCAKFPSGAVIVWAGDKILGYADSFQYTHNEYCFTKFDHIPTGRFYSDSTIVDLIPLQKEYNRTRSQIIEAKNRMAKPQLIAARGSVDPNKVTSEPGLIIFYTPGFSPPEPLPLVSLPNYVIEELDRTQRDMDDISSQHEVTKGRTPPGVTAATAISYLQEEDDSKLAGTVSSLEEGVEKLGRHFLSHVQQFWSAEREVHVIGDNNMYETFAFTKSDIAGNTDFRVEAGSATPRSRAAKQAFIMEAMDKGYIPPQRGLRYLDMAETGRLYEELQINARQAQRENLIMAQGVEVEIHSWDDHLAHIEEHDDFRKKQEYDKLDDQTKMIFESHNMKHKQYLCAMFGQMFAPGDPRIDGFIIQLKSGQIPPMMGQAPQGSEMGGDPNAVDSGGSSQIQEGPQQ